MVGKNNLKVGKNNLLNRAVFGILSAFIENAYSEMYFNQIVKETNLNRSTILSELNKLLRLGIVKKTRKGNSDYYKITKGQRAIALLSYVEYCKTDKFIKENYKLGNSLNAFEWLDTKAVACAIFGSQAKGYAKKTSDVDIVWIGNYTKEDIKMSEAMARTAYARAGISISAVLINTADVEKNKFLAEIKKSHLILYGADFLLRRFL